MNLHRTIKYVSIFLLALLPSAVLTTNAQTSSGTPASRADKQFVVAAIRGGMAEVELGKLAIEKGNSEDLKQFAQKMVTDRTQLGEQMKQVAHQIGVTPPSALSPSDRALEARLKTLSGDAFDRAYIQAMVKVHEDELGEFNQEIADASSFVVKDAAREGAKAIQGLLDIIRKIAQSNNVDSK
jgi:putative membrane protein